MARRPQPPPPMPVSEYVTRCKVRALESLSECDSSEAIREVFDKFVKELGNHRKINGAKAIYGGKVFPSFEMFASVEAMKRFLDGF